jgi:hypothetical protein
MPEATKHARVLDLRAPPPANLAHADVFSCVEVVRRGEATRAPLLSVDTRPFRHSSDNFDGPAWRQSGRSRFYRRFLNEIQQFNYPAPGAPDLFIRVPERSWPLLRIPMGVKRCTVRMPRIMHQLDRAHLMDTRIPFSRSLEELVLVLPPAWRCLRPDANGRYADTTPSTNAYALLLWELMLVRVGIFAAEHGTHVTFVGGPDPFPTMGFADFTSASRHVLELLSDMASTSLYGEPTVPAPMEEARQGSMSLITPEEWRGRASKLEIEWMEWEEGE